MQFAEKLDVSIEWEAVQRDQSETVRYALYEELGFNEDLVGVKLEDLFFRAVTRLQNKLLDQATRSTAISHHGYEITITILNCPVAQ